MSCNRLTFQKFSSRARTLLVLLSCLGQQTLGGGALAAPGANPGKGTFRGNLVRVDRALDAGSAALGHGLRASLYEAVGRFQLRRAVRRLEDHGEMPHIVVKHAFQRQPARSGEPTPVSVYSGHRYQLNAMLREAVEQLEPVPWVRRLSRLFDRANKATRSRAEIAYELGPSGNAAFSSGFQRGTEEMERAIVVGLDHREGLTVPSMLSKLGHELKHNEISHAKAAAHGRLRRAVRRAESHKDQLLGNRTRQPIAEVIRELANARLAVAALPQTYGAEEIVVYERQAKLIGKTGAAEADGIPWFAPSTDKRVDELYPPREINAALLRGFFRGIEERFGAQTLRAPLVQSYLEGYREALLKERDRIEQQIYDTDAASYDWVSHPPTVHQHLRDMVAAAWRHLKDNYALRHRRLPLDDATAKTQGFADATFFRMPHAAIERLIAFDRASGNHRSAGQLDADKGF